MFARVGPDLGDIVKELIISYFNLVYGLGVDKGISLLLVNINEQTLLTVCVMVVLRDI